jgi:hypothetical protein
VNFSHIPKFGILGCDKAFGDSLLLVQQVADVFQYFDGSLNSYIDKCLKIIALFNDFTVQHASRDENSLANDLTQQTSGFQSNRGKFSFLPVCQTKQSGFQPMHSATVCSIEPSLAKLDVPVSETGLPKISRISVEASKMTTVDPDD